MKAFFLTPISEEVIRMIGNQCELRSLSSFIVKGARGAPDSDLKMIFPKYRLGKSGFRF